MGCGLCGPNSHCICASTGRVPEWAEPQYNLTTLAGVLEQRVETLTEMVIALTEHIANLEDRLGPIENAYGVGGWDDEISTSV